MVWELIIVCITVYILFGDYMKAKADHLSAEAEFLEAETELMRDTIYRKEK